MSEILARLLMQNESAELDFKEQVRMSTDLEKAELAKDMSAFANTRGGHIIFGVEDDTRRQVGIDPQTFDEAKIQQTISSRCYPPVNFSAQLVLLDELHFGLLTIPSSPLKPHQIIQTREIFIRRGSTTDRATRDEIESMIDERRRGAEAGGAEEILKDRNWGLRESPEGTRCLSISVCPVPLSGSILTLTRETGETLWRLIPYELGTFNGYPTQHTYVLESVGKVDSIPRRRIEITRNGLIEFSYVQDAHARFVHLGNVSKYFTLFMHYVISVYREAIPYGGDVYLLLAMNKLEGKQLSTGEMFQELTLEDWQCCRQETIKIVRQVTLPINVETILKDVSDELKHCFGLE